MRILLSCLAALLMADGLRAETVNGAPALILSRTNVPYSPGAGPLLLDNDALVRDPDSPNFDGGTLTVAFVPNGAPEDRLGIRNQGAGPGHIFTSGQIVSYATQPIGAFLGGTNGASPLIVTFNGKATAEAVQALARSVTYDNIAAQPSPESRRVRLVLTDGDGGTSAPAFLDIRLASSNTPPAAIATVSPLVFLAAPATNGVVLSANNSNAVVVLDGSLSSDMDHDALTYSWFDGAATSPFALGSNVTNRLAVGLHTLRLQVFDGRATSEAAVTVEIITPGEAVEGIVRLVMRSGLPRQRLQPLIATLKTACAAFERGQFAAAANQLEAFQNKIRAQIAPADAVRATNLTRYAQWILDALPGR